MQRAGRIGQSQYWTIFGIYMVLVPVLLFGGIGALIAGLYAVGMIAVLLVLPLGIYFRIAMMRRCRDIGWPAFLPWLLFLIPTILGFLSGARLSGTGLPALSVLALPLIASLIDFVFAIVIGCIATKQDDDYTRIFGPGPCDPGPARPATLPPGSPSGQPRPATPPALAAASGEPDYSSFDAAVARAIEARRNPQPDQAPNSAPAPEPSAHARAVAGFGRRRVI